MIVSHQHKFIFIHIQKTAGSSISEYLKEHSQCEEIGKHWNALAVRKFLGEKIWNEYFKFSFVRNPFDRLVSWYNMIASTKEDINGFFKYVHANADTFADFIEKCDQTVYEDDGIKSVRIPQFDYLSDEQGNLLIDFVGKFENLEKDFKFICEKIGLPYEGLNKINSYEHSAYENFYNESLLAKTEKIVKKDMEKFDYQKPILPPN
ncbi:MAG TPA: sulfotransferase family 2 domain-containing protein [Candidatus Magasanikbacteria bacterium]|nr:sulfotransferase family 2 domain-containing protein [Candidatus Magasanikbacteria bacterium]